MYEPAQGKAAVTGFITGQFFQHFHFGSCMAEHVHKIVYDDTQVMIQQVVRIVDQFLRFVVIDDFIIGKFYILAFQPFKLLR